MMQTNICLTDWYARAVILRFAELKPSNFVGFAEFGGGR